MIDWMDYRPSGPLVLVVDDDSRIRAYIKMILQSSGVSGVQVLEAGDGLEALNVFQTWGDRIALVITDIRMPHMTGVDLATALRLDHPALPLIFVSGEPATDGLNDPQQGLMVIEKPFAPNALLDAARYLLN